MTPDGAMRAALEPKSCLLSRAVKAIAPPPGPGRPGPVNHTGLIRADWNRPEADRAVFPRAVPRVRCPHTARRMKRS